MYTVLMVLELSLGRGGNILRFWGIKLWQGYNNIPTPTLCGSSLNHRTALIRHGHTYIYNYYTPLQGLSSVVL